MRHINIAWTLSQSYVPFLYSMPTIQVALCLGEKTTFPVENREDWRAFITNLKKSAGTSD
jgi:hypothetical protein